MFYSSRPYHFYNPYDKPYLAFLIQNNSGSTNSVPPNQVDDVPPEEYMQIFSNMDLYAQPPNNPIITFALVLPIQLIFVASAIFIQSRTLQMLNQEKSINNKMMVTQAKIHILFWPLWVAAVTFTDTIYPIADLTSPILCFVLQFYIHFCGFSIILYSFYAALLRYLYCLHTTYVNMFGKSKLINIIYWIFYIHTLMWTLYTIFTDFNLDHIPVINKCYGHFDEVFLMESTPLDMVRRHFCALEATQGK